MLRCGRTLLLVVVLRELAYVHNHLGLGVTYILWKIKVRVNPRVVFLFFLHREKEQTI